MPAISGNGLALRTARAGSAIAGISRAGFAPTETQSTTGVAGPTYRWKRATVLPATAAWTKVR